MARQSFGIVEQEIERLLQRGSLAGLSDWQLLERYATERDELAFEALVARHGPMVLRVCRLVLLNAQAAEDAFQATEAFRAMFVYKLKIAGAVLLAAAMLGSCASMLLNAASRVRPSVQAVERLTELRPNDAEVAGERLPSGVLARMGSTRLRHGDAISFAAYMPDGNALVTAGRDKTVRLWDLATGNALCVFEWDQAQPEGEAGASQDGAIAVNDRNALVSPGWKYLAFLARNDTGNRLIHIRDRVTGKETAQINAGGLGSIQVLCFSADEKTLVWDHNPGRGVVVSDAATGKELRRLRYHRRGDGDGPYDQAMAIALSADGKSLAVARMSHTIELWDLPSGKATYPVGKPTEAQLELRVTDVEGAYVRPALAFSADSKKLACSLGSETARQFQTDTGSEIPGTDDGHRWPVSTLALSDDGKSLYTYGQGDLVPVWDWATGKETGRHRAPDRATHAAFAGEGRIAFVADREFTLRGAGGEKTWKIAEPPVSMALSPDGRLVAMRFWPNPEVQMRDTATGQERYTLARADNRLDTTPEIHVWDVLAGREVGVLKGHQGGVVSLLFGADGKHLFSGGTDTTTLTWDLTRLIRHETARREADHAAARLETQALDSLWADLAAQDATRAFDAMRELSAFSDQAVALIRERVRPASPADPKRVAGLLADLGNSRFEVRRQAQSALEKLGDLAEPALRKVLDGDAPVTLRRRVERLLEKRFAPTAEQMRDLRAVELLELLRGADARQVLESLADGLPGTRLTRAARGSVERLNKQVITP